MATFKREDFGYSRTVSYVNSSHLSVLTQRWGSVNKKVAPFVMANVILSVLLVWLLEHGIDLSISEFGHEFMSVLVAFFTINKLSFTLSLYYEYQGYLAKMNESSIELTQLACSFTSGYQQMEYKEWRYNVTQQVLILLKATSLLVYKSGQNNQIWKLPEFNDDPLDIVYPNEENNGTYAASSTAFQLFNTNACNRHMQLPKDLFVWGLHLDSDKNLRVPLRVAQRLREAIVNRKNFPYDPVDAIREKQLLNCVKDFMNSYHGIRKYLTCPLPLPLVQLGRLFVIFYVFTLPFALLSSTLNLKYFQMILLVCLMTYGFMGIELLYVEIDDPFADDPNDLPLTEEAHATGEDVILSLFRVDGHQAIDRIKTKTEAVNLPLQFSKDKKQRHTEKDPLI